MIVLGLFLNSLAGFLIHVLFGRKFEQYYSPIFSRLASYVVGLTYEIIGSFGIALLYTRYVGDRRKFPIKFERYFVIRLLSIISLFVGIVAGYMTDEENGH